MLTTYSLFNWVMYLHMGFSFCSIIENHLLCVFVVSSFIWLYQMMTYFLRSGMQILREANFENSEKNYVVAP